VSILLPLLKRTTQLILLSLLVTLATFALSSCIPGDYFSKHFLDPTMGPEMIVRLRRQYGLDQPVYLQYFRWLGNLCKLDLGYSLLYQRPVFFVVADALRKTLWLGVPALTLGFGGGVVLGTLHGIHRNRMLGRFMDLMASVMLSLPSLVLGIAALLLAAQTRWFPLGSMSSTEIEQFSYWSWLIDRVHHLALPVFCLTVPILASIERIQFAATRDCVESQFLRSAQARGLSPGSIFFRHLLLPSLNPVLSTSGPILGGVLSGSLVLEVIFAWPGLGQTTYDALFNNDLFLLVGCVVASSILLVGGNLIADILVLLLDPRTREASRGLQT
jgi:peptide/nickel transport system permease protein